MSSGFSDMDFSAKEGGNADGQTMLVSGKVVSAEGAAFTKAMAQATDKSISASVLEDFGGNLRLKSEETMAGLTRPKLVEITTQPFHQRPPDLHNTIGNISTYIHFLSPIIILLFFLTAFAVRGIRLASSATEDAKSHGSTAQLYGPGGKPLPIRKITGLKRRQDRLLDFTPMQKLAFQYLSIFVSLSFFVSVVGVIVHVYLERGWWCGEAQFVSTCL
jgi:hypothetical protein